MSQLLCIKDVHERFKERVADQRALAHEIKNIWKDDLYPNGRTEAYIIAETKTRYSTLRIVARPEDIEAQRRSMEDSGIYLSVIIAQKVK